MRLERFDLSGAEWSERFASLQPARHVDSHAAKFSESEDRNGSVMLEKPPRGLFVVGTDTSVGKTHVTCRLAVAARERGIRVAAYKPAESGWENPLDPRADAVRLWRACGEIGTVAEVCPQRFRSPLAPHLAAEIDQLPWDSQLLVTGASVWKDRCDLLLVEGAGGFLSPLGPDQSVADLANQLGYPLLLVADDRVGVINQVRMALAAAQLHSPALKIAGVVLNRVTAAEDLSHQSNAAVLRSLIEPPILAVVDHQSESIDWHEAIWDWC